MYKIFFLAANTFFLTETLYRKQNYILICMYMSTNTYSSVFSQVNKARATAYDWN